MNKAHILIVDDDRTFRLVTSDVLRDEGYRVVPVQDIDEARKRLAEEPFDLILCDLVMEGGSGLQLLEYSKSQQIEAPFIMITGFASVDSAVEAMKLGAEDYITKPCSHDALLLKIERTLDKYRNLLELQRLRKEVQGEFQFGNLKGQSAKMRQVVEMLRQVAETDASVLLYGETGTGKEMAARAIHYNGPRKDRPFVGVNCAALSETLLESELFGHEKGAFTGAIRQKPGRFEMANGGTLFLDEIGNMPLATQAKLLRVLQERQFERVGGTESISVDIRIISATNTDLKKAMEAGRFREDLYYRLNVIPIHLPPLRERMEDLPLLAQHFLEKYATRFNKPVRGISPAAMELLLRQSWPGNVRQLENTIERAVVLCRSETIEPQHLLLQSEDPAVQLIGDAVARRLSEDELNRLYARMILAEVGGNKKEACRILKINYRTLQSRIEEDDSS